MQLTLWQLSTGQTLTPISIHPNPLYSTHITQQPSLPNLHTQFTLKPMKPKSLTQSARMPDGKNQLSTRLTGMPMNQLSAPYLDAIELAYPNSCTTSGTQATNISNTMHLQIALVPHMHMIWKQLIISSHAQIKPHPPITHRDMTHFYMQSHYSKHHLRSYRHGGMA